MMSNKIIQLSADVDSVLLKNPGDEGSRLPRKTDNFPSWKNKVTRYNGIKRNKDTVEQTTADVQRLRIRSPSFKQLPKAVKLVATRSIIHEEIKKASNDVFTIKQLLFEKASKIVTNINKETICDSIMSPENPFFVDQIKNNGIVTLSGIISNEIKIRESVIEKLSDIIKERDTFKYQIDTPISTVQPHQSSFTSVNNTVQQKVTSQQIHDKKIELNFKNLNQKTMNQQKAHHQPFCKQIMNSQINYSSMITNQSYSQSMVDDPGVSPKNESSNAIDNPIRMIYIIQKKELFKYKIYDVLWSTYKNDGYYISKKKNSDYEMIFKQFYVSSEILSVTRILSAFFYKHDIKYLLSHRDFYLNIDLKKFLKDNHISDIINDNN